MTDVAKWEGDTLETLPTETLTPNDYNPNRMKPNEFAELVEEVRHLGRLPKPVVVRATREGIDRIFGDSGQAG